MKTSSMPVKKETANYIPIQSDITVTTEMDTQIKQKRHLYKAEMQQPYFDQDYVQDLPKNG